VNRILSPNVPRRAGKNLAVRGGTCAQMSSVYFKLQRVLRQSTSRDRFNSKHGSTSTCIKEPKHVMPTVPLRDPFAALTPKFCTRAGFFRTELRQPHRPRWPHRPRCRPGEAGRAGGRRAARAAAARAARRTLPDGGPATSSAACLAPRR